jgi:hypothetical protein
MTPTIKNVTTSKQVREPSRELNADELAVVAGGTLKPYPAPPIPIHRTPPTDSTKTIVSPILILLSLAFLMITLVGVQFSSRYMDALGAIALGGAMARLTGIPFKISN